MRKTLLLITVLTACDRAPVAPATPPSMPPAPAPVVPELAEPGALQGATWTFYDPPGPLSCGLFGGGANSAHCDPHFIAEHPPTFHVHDGHVRRDDGETSSYDVALDTLADAAAVVVGLSGPALYLAGVVDGDVVIERRRASDGVFEATQRIAHPGSPATAVQLETGDRLFVNARAERPWMAVLDADGRLLDRAEVGITLADLAPGAHAWSATRAVAEADGVRAERRHLRSRTPAWDVPLLDPFDCGAYALVPLANEIALLHHCPAGSGATLTFFDRATGAAVVDVVGGTIGSVGHSRYRADVSIAYDHELVWIRGDESSGDYVCVVDPRAHRTLACAIAR